jgi:hypothetical protein
VKPTKQTKLIASAPNQTGIIKLISRYWCTSEDRIRLEPSLELQDCAEVWQGDKLMIGFQVRAVRNRFRFEYIGGES